MINTQMNTSIKETVVQLLNYIRAAKTESDPLQPWDVFPEPVNVFVRMVYDSGIWDKNFRSKMKTLEKADLSGISLEDVYSYFTAIVAIERCFRGFVEQKVYDGTMEQLLIRYLNLMEENK